MDDVRVMGCLNARRYLRNQPSLYREALARLVEEEQVEPGEEEMPRAQPEETLETPRIRPHESDRPMSSCAGK